MEERNQILMNVLQWLLSRSTISHTHSPHHPSTPTTTPVSRLTHLPLSPHTHITHPLPQPVHMYILQVIEEFLLRVNALISTVLTMSGLLLLLLKTFHLKILDLSFSSSLFFNVINYFSSFLNIVYIYIYIYIYIYV